MVHVLLISLIFWGLIPHMVSAADIILDSGHTSKSSGATACSGRNEYDYNKSLTEVIQSYLTANDKTVALTSSKKNNLSLESRSKQAKGHNVLLSIHHDSVQPQFVTKNNQTGGYCSDKATGFSIFVSKKNADYESSLLYARKLGEALVLRGLKPTLHHAEQIKGESRTLLVPELGIYRFDDLRVLKDTKTPAVLLEAAVIVNPKDEEQVSSVEFQKRISEAVLVMVER